MNRVLIDTNIYSEALRGNDYVVAKLQSCEIIAISPIIIGELLSGFKGGNKYQKNLDELNKFLDSPRVQIIQLTFTTADFYSEVFTKLKKAGTPIPTNDIWIAASALENGLKIFTLDKHYLSVAGLVFY
ncbi:MAG: PIN domain-containing protein [Actinobacteria bacterium]|nr:PIN domain-containing protein [Actinomycetota bacterium]